MKPTIYFATDHAGFALKNILVPYVRDELGYPVIDCGAHNYDAGDDYPDFIGLVADKIAHSPRDRAVILGGSGQGEAMVANRWPGVRATVYYGEKEVTAADQDGAPLSIIEASRLHNDANVLSLGARFITAEEAKQVVSLWLSLPFSGEERHSRRIKKMEKGSL